MKINWTLFWQVVSALEAGYIAIQQGKIEQHNADSPLKIVRLEDAPTDIQANYITYDPPCRVPTFKWTVVNKPIPPCDPDNLPPAWRDELED